MKEQLRQFVLENFLFGQNSEFSDYASLQGSGIIDSTGVLELVAFLEKTYCVRIEDDEIIPENLDSINRLARFVEQKLREPGGGAVAQPIQGMS
jgi:acyl carrier protein